MHYYHKKMIDTVIEISNINPNKQVNEITKRRKRKFSKYTKKIWDNNKGF